MGNSSEEIYDTENWREGAGCIDINPSVFHPDNSDTAGIKRAKSFCNKCVVKEFCLIYSIQNHQEDGIWGGLTAEERRRIR